MEGCHRLSVCVCRVDLFIPGVDTVGGFSMCSSPGLLQREGVVELAVKYSRHPPAHWVHSQVRTTVWLSALAEDLTAGGISLPAKPKQTSVLLQCNNVVIK